MRSLIASAAYESINSQPRDSLNSITSFTSTTFIFLAMIIFAAVIFFDLYSIFKNKRNK